MCFSWIIETTRSVIAWVFPDHAQVLMRSGSSMVSTAILCSGLSFVVPKIIVKKLKKWERILEKCKLLICYCSMNHIITSDFFQEFPEIVYWTSTKWLWPLSFLYSKNNNQVIIDRVNFLDQLWLHPNHSVLVCEQNHTNNIAIIDHEFISSSLFDQEKQIPNTDGIITNIPWMNLVIYTADCMPITFYDPIRRVIGIVHSGWKWTIGWIWKKMIHTMIDNYGSKVGDIRVVVGPSIWPCCYSVKNEEQIELFESLYHNNQLRFDKVYIDLWDSLVQDMLATGILHKHFHNQRLCTSCQNDVFASHRKDNPNTTVNLTVISLIQ